MLQDAFVLWDTYGFPLDLTQVHGVLLSFYSHFIPIELAPNAIFVNQLMAEERGLVVDIEGFNIAMNEARERSRNAQNKVAVFVLFLLFWASYLDVFVIHILLCASCTREKREKGREVSARRK